MKRSSSSSSSSLLARAVAILLVIICCCSLLSCPCSANEKLGQESGEGEGLWTRQGWMPPDNGQEAAGTRQGMGPPSPWHPGGYGMSYPPYGHGGAALAPAHRKDLQVSKN